jgi:hypothetical protein
MKCIKFTRSGDPQGDKPLRCEGNLAAYYVNDGFAVYVSKAEWKRVTRDPARTMAAWAMSKIRS